MSLALIDGDIIAFRAAAGVAQSYFGDDEPTSNPEMAREAALMAVQAWTRIARCKDVLVTFTGSHNFRKLVLPSYKAHRTKGKPADYWTTVEAVQDQYPTQIVHGLEGDDLLGILATTDKYADRAIILSQDKDMATIPGRFLNPLKETKPRVITPEAADYWWLTQTITGDSTDGYKGIPGVGPKKAAIVLGALSPRTPVGALWEKVVAAYRAAKLTEDDALIQARCARILRRGDYDKATKEILLWHPTSPVRLPLATVCASSGTTPTTPQ